MARTIAVSDEVYVLLKKTKMPDESFSKVIRRSLKRVSKLSDIVGSGTLSYADWKRTQRKIRDAEETTLSEITGR